MIRIPLSNDGPFTLQVNNRADKGSASTGNVLRYKQISVDVEYTLQTIGYTYDAASRVLDADCFPGGNTASTPGTTFAYEYDVAGNLTDNNGTARTFNKLNHISSGGVTYDANGNMTNDGTKAYTWDRDDRLLSMGGHEYAYDGVDNRTSQTVSSVVTQYLLDLQPSLAQVITSTTGSNTESYLHSPRGIHATQDAFEDWRYTLQDGLGSVRGEVGGILNVAASGAYEPYGVSTDVEGTYTQPFRFTGEMLDENALQYHRARYYAPVLAAWTTMDPFEGITLKPISLSLYQAMDNNPINWIDAAGLQTTPTSPDIGFFISQLIAAGAEVVQGAVNVAKASPPAILFNLFTLRIFHGLSFESLDTGRALQATIQAARDTSDASRIFQPSAAATAVPFPRVPTPSGNAPLGDIDWGILGLLAGLCLAALQRLIRSSPQDRDFDPDPDESCDQGRSPQDAAREYARVANAEYFLEVSRRIGGLRPPMVFAVTRARRIGTNVCEEVVGVNDRVNTKERQRLWNSAISTVRDVAEARFALLGAGTNFPGRGHEHAKFNLLNALGSYGFDLSSFRAMGVSQRPCSDPNPYNCSARLMSIQHFAIAYHSLETGEIENF